tara:strand:+ start:245 stop:457 length:213 start_codon:yes stop_codon:yes gene_type:complete
MKSGLLKGINNTKVPNRLSIVLKTCFIKLYMNHMLTRLKQKLKTTNYFALKGWFFLQKKYQVFGKEEISL